MIEEEGPPVAPLERLHAEELSGRGMEHDEQENVALGVNPSPTLHR